MRSRWFGVRSASFIALLAIAFTETVAAETYWRTSGGSVAVLTEAGDQVEIRFVEVSSAGRQLGVSPGTVTFQGQRRGNELIGTGVAFPSSGCRLLQPWQIQIDGNYLVIRGNSASQVPQGNCRGSQYVSNFFRWSRVGSTGNNRPVARSVEIGKSVEVGRSVPIGKPVEIGRSVGIGRSEEIGKPATIGKSVDIGSSAPIGSSTAIGKSVNGGRSVAVGTGTEIGKSVSNGTSDTVGTSVETGKSVATGRSVDVGISQTIGSSKNVGVPAKIGDGKDVSSSTRIGSASQGPMQPTDKSLGHTDNIAPYSPINSAVEKRALDGAKLIADKLSNANAAGLKAVATDADFKKAVTDLKEYTAAFGSTYSKTLAITKNARIAVVAGIVAGEFTDLKGTLTELRTAPQNVVLDKLGDQIADRITKKAGNQLGVPTAAWDAAKVGARFMMAYESGFLDSVAPNGFAR
jgi:acyl-[acyl carrier protein]--UDP-N-acetylglucosamine O-acyltransferase